MKIGKVSSTTFGKIIEPFDRTNNRDSVKTDKGIAPLNSTQAEALKAQALYGGLTEAEKSYIKPDEIRIPSLFDIEDDVHISTDKVEKKEYNAAGLNVVKYEDEDKKYVEITNDRGNTIFRGEAKLGAEIPTLTYKQGKFMPEVTVKDESLNGSVIKMFAGSKIEGENFKFVMPGAFKDIKNNETISFKGHTVITTLNKEHRTKNAVDLYMNSNLKEQATYGDDIEFLKEHDPVLVIPAGGFGERFKNLTRNSENKPSAKLPTRDEYRIIATALNMGASMGIIDKDNEKNDLTYISQKHEIYGDNVHHAGSYKTDGGAIAEALDEDYIDRHKDIIILNGDIITNADMSRTYKKFKTLPNAALVIPYYPVDAQRAKSFGLLGFREDDLGNKRLVSFVEKTPYTSEAPLPEQFSSDKDYEKAMNGYLEARHALNPNGDGTFLANPGIYILSPEATKVLRHMGIKDPSSTGLGASVMPKIVEMCNKGELEDSAGNKMKAYIVPLEAKRGANAFWDDIGTAEAYLSTIKDIALETSNKGIKAYNKYYGIPNFVLEDFENNVDLDTGIVYMGPGAKDNMHNFRTKYSAHVQGNILTT